MTPLCRTGASSTSAAPGTRAWGRTQEPASTGAAAHPVHVPGPSQPSHTAGMESPHCSAPAALGQPSPASADYNHVLFLPAGPAAQPGAAARPTTGLSLCWTTCSLMGDNLAPGCSVPARLRQEPDEASPGGLEAGGRILPGVEVGGEPAGSRSRQGKEMLGARRRCRAGPALQGQALGALAPSRARGDRG